MLSLRDRNRTLLLRQHLLARCDLAPLAVVEHLVGLQAQENLPPYLSLAARIEGFDPQVLSAAIEHREAVRLLTMRGTIHVLTGDDALALRPWVQPALDRQSGSNQLNRPAREVPVEELAAEVRRVLADGPLPVKALGERLAERFAGVPAAALGHVARERLPLVQVPPRGLWQRSGGVVYQTVESWLGRPTTPVDLPGLVRRYLAAFGPATAADMTAWSRVTKLGPVFTALRDELVAVECDDGVVRYDVPGAPYADGTQHAPARLLGTYDNLWLSHADRSHVVDEEARSRWMGTNGGVGRTVWLDGFMAGLWRWRDGEVELDLVAQPTRAQRAELDAEVDRVRALLGDGPG